jgi:hypothetical protein
MLLILALFFLSQRGIKKLGSILIPIGFPVAMSRDHTADFYINNEFRARQTVKAGHNLNIIMRGDGNISTFLGGLVRKVSLHNGVSINSTHAKSSHFIRESLDTKIMS